LIANDGSVVYGRTVEWGAFDLLTRIAIFPRDFTFAGLTPDGRNGKEWTAQYGFVGLDALLKDMITDGMNEKGLAVGLFYHPGFAEYPEYVPAQASNTITAVDVASYILSQCATINDVCDLMSDVLVVPVVEEAIGIPIPAHWMVTDESGEAIVIEYTDKKVKIHENPLGVITNSPNYDWHMTNLRNYVNLSQVAIPKTKIGELDFAPLGAGSGMIGLPGDFTPPSRFVRAVAFTQTARPVENSKEAVYETLRILDNFNLPLGSAEGSTGKSDNLKGMRSSTIWTSVWDLEEKVLYYHTQHNRRLRKLSLSTIDFSFTAKEPIRLPLDREKEQDVEAISVTE
jgi:choloylglycine hydrolase